MMEHVLDDDAPPPQIPDSGVSINIYGEGNVVFVHAHGPVTINRHDASTSVGLPTANGTTPARRADNATS